ncbi:acetylxylan esterase [Enterococcus gallinarum]|uniref:Acetylxylan esterase n=1 Tax=Enterococcus gallinarum TaxID=1353 RepID=A0AAE4KX65_ENTGA|nr:acetylxylan esterase [Enterococcus gallinarum]MDT2685486.1 acetylxylan esterase [Enterococcus gallinarum]MDT2689916.1 acetylxylan esterase [Enterococcus gallinarum]
MKSIRNVPSQEEIDRFWRQVKQEIKQIPLAFERKQQPALLTGIDVYQVNFQSLYNETIYGYLLVPKNKSQLPIVIDYLGYMNHLQEPFQFAHWALIDCACLVIDNRGQGGRTKDTHPYETTQHEAPFGRGILKKEDFYMKRMIADSLRLLEVAAELPEIDSERVILRGGSQGGGIALIVNALAETPIFATFADVPSHSNISHRIESRTGSYHVMQEYIDTFPDSKETIYYQMAYYDLKNLAAKITGPVFASVGSQDPICPMTDFFVSYHRISTPKQLTVYLNKGHGGGEAKQIRKEMQQIQKLLKRI